MLPEFHAAEEGYSLILHDPHVLPRLSRQRLHQALSRIKIHETETVLQHHVMPVGRLPGMVLYACCGQRGFEYAKQNGLKLIAQVAPRDFHFAIRLAWGRNLLRRAVSHLSREMPEFSASRRLTTGQIAALLCVLMSCIASVAFLSPALLWTLASAIFGLFFLSVMLLRLFCILPLHSFKTSHSELADENELPFYSVLVPVFREVAVLDQLLSALGNLDYPHDKLDIKIIVEESDTSLRHALQRYELPPHFEMIVVPRGKPQTKPRALNYALQFCRGDFLTIYDAEDIPEPSQLLDALECFRNSSDEKLACVQAQLVFFNSNENWLTRQFTAEYATLFGIVLPALASHGLPLPLGGTSNHFRTDVLRKIGGWDSHNVTEDADLGLRLARLGYRTGVISSFTYEEANTQRGNWLNQRARWLKGFLQTWLVHMRHPAKLLKEIGPSGFWVIQSCTIGVFISALLHPFLLLLTGVLLWNYPPFRADMPIWLTLVNGVNLLIFAAGYGVTMAAEAKALRLRGFQNWRGTIATIPFYWFLMSAAAWLALYQFLVAPFEWNKTEHGLSRMQQRE
jgi:glycosyltransferase XagB